MTLPSVSSERIRFDAFEADLRTQELKKSGRKLRLPNQSFRVLAALLDKPGELVTREALILQLWPAGAFVEHDGSLNAAVNRLREALGDSAERPRYIETLPKRGYRFVASIDRVGSPAVLTDAPPVVEPTVSKLASPPNRFSARLVGAYGLCVILGIVAFATIENRLRTAHRPSVAHPPLGREIVPFTSLPGQEVSPTISPDGSQIAFAWNGDEGANQHFDLFVKAIGSEHMVRVTNLPSSWISAAWSPDGTSIAFVRTSGGSTGIFVVPALGGAERRIVDDAVGVWHYIQIGWSPDGKRLVYSRYGATGAQQIFTVSLDTLISEPLSPAPPCWDAAEPAYSPDGSRIAFICTLNLAVYDIYIAAIADRRLQRLASVNGDARGLTWAADGTHIIFSNDIGDGGTLWALDLSGQLTQLAFGESGVGPTIRGSRLAYVRGQNTINIWRTDLMAASPEKSARKLIYSTRAQIEPRYSQDGTQIAFQSNRSGRTEIWVANAEGTDAVRVTSFNGPFTNAPSWCSDGRRIAFDSRTSGKSAIYVEDINERLPRALDASRENLSLPVWSADCRWLFASDGRTTLYRVPVAGGPAQQFTHLPAAHSSVSGDKVIFAVKHPDGLVLWMKPAEGGAEHPLENMPQLQYSDAWTTSLNAVYYTDTSMRPISVNEYSFADRKSRRIMNIEKVPEPGEGPGMTVSPDGRWLLITEIDDAQTEIMLGPSPY